MRLVALSKLISDMTREVQKSMRSHSDLRLGSRLTAAVLTGLLTMSSVAPYAIAQGKPPAADAGKKMTEKQKKDAARSHYNEGKKRLDANDYAGAVTEFEAANALIPSPQAQQKIAACYDGMGKTAEAIAAYEKFIEQAKDKANLAADVDAAKARVTALRNAPVAVKVTSDPASASVEVDGAAQMGATPMDVKLTPGTHKVKVSAPGYEPMEKDVEVKAGEAAPDLAFALTQAAAPPVVAPPVEPVAAPPPPAADMGPQEPRSNVPAYVTLGVAGASLIVGGIFGVKALGDKSSFNDNPTADKADTAERDALIADMAFGVAVTLGVTGTVLLLSGGKKEAQKGLWNSPTKTVQITPLVTPHSAGAGAVLRF